MLLHLLFNQINADLVSIKYFVQKHWKSITDPKLLNGSVYRSKKKSYVRFD